MSAGDWLDPHFGPVSVVVVGLMLAYTVWKGLVDSPRRYRELAAARDAHDSITPRRFYRRAIRIQVVRSLVVLAVLITDGGVDRQDLGLVLPVGDQHQIWGWFAYFVVLLGVSVMVMRRRVAQGKGIPGQRLAAALIARDGERVLGSGMAVGAGISEELLFRGLFLAATVDLLDVSPLTALVLTSVGFGAMHLYQGPWGIIGTALAGFVLGTLYLSSHSLLVPVLVHALVDLRGMVAVPVAVSTGRRRRH